MATFTNIREQFELRGRNYVVTGGAQGIGFCLVNAIAQMGGNVVALDLKETPSEGFQALGQKYGVTTGYVKADVTDEKSVSDAFQSAVGILGGVDGCVTCAGIALEKPFEQTTFDEVSRIQNVNVVGTYITAQLAAEQMKKQGTGGSLILVASITSHTVLPFHHMSAYGASKGAVKILSEALAVELSPSKIRVNSISPGFIDTEMTQEVRNANPVMNDIMNKTPPLQRIGTRDDLMGAVIYLLSDASSYTTGSDIAITGGLHIGRFIGT
ncbi:hypothetical protein BKA56DRAFT_523617 [Ilyonectria sp. MPI-CAGE-AT-0026]|nr:hypothetical protein BKA56DRAFT_523617 [Ilyonectria sp. MPI-CAGE-AT-0026]